MVSHLNFYISWTFFFACCLAVKAEDLKAGNSKAVADLNQVVFVVMSQTSKHHISIANVTVNSLKNNLILNGVQNPKVWDVQKEFSGKGSWTFFPIFPSLYDQVRCLFSCKGPIKYVRGHSNKGPFK